MDITTIAERIEKYIDRIELISKALPDRGEKLATAIAEYDKALAVRILELRQTETPVTLIEKIAKGDIWEKRLDLEKAEASMKSAKSNLEAACVNLSALQTLNRYLDRGTK